MQIMPGTAFQSLFSWIYSEDSHNCPLLASVSQVSILVLMDLLGRLRVRDVAVALAVGFQSLFSWIYSEDTFDTERTGYCGRSFNPCSHGFTRKTAFSPQCLIQPVSCPNFSMLFFWLLSLIYPLIDALSPPVFINSRSVSPYNYNTFSYHIILPR